MCGRQESRRTFFIIINMKQKYITAAELAKQCNIDTVDAGETTYLENLLDASVSTIENKIQQPITDVLDEDRNLPAPLKSAALLIAANLYANREPVAYGTPQRIP